MNPEKNLHKLRDAIMNHALVVGFLFGLLSYIVTLVRAFEYGFNAGFWLVTVGVMLFAVLVWNRRKVSLNIKVYSIMTVVLMALISGLIKYGFLVSSKAYIILIPIFVSFILEYRKALLLLIFYGVVYVCFGILYMTEIIPFTINAREYVLSPTAWSMDVTIIMLTALILLLVGKQYSDAILKNQEIIQERNREVENREKKYHYLFENLLDAILLLHEGQIIDMNKKALEMFEMTREQALGWHIKDMAPGFQQDGQKSPDKIMELISISEQGKPVYFEWQFIKYNKEVFDASVNMIQVVIDEEVYCQVIIEDITEEMKNQKELEQYRFRLEELVFVRTRELEKANAELLHINKDLKDQKDELKNTLKKLHQAQEKLIETAKMASLGVLTAGVAHEINNPLNFIQAGLYGLRNNLSEVSGKMEPMELLNNNEPIFHAMEEGVYRISEIVRSLNHFNRKNETTCSNCSIICIIDNCIRILEHEIKGRIKVIKQHKDGKMFVWGNEGGLHQAFMNLIYNAIQATLGIGSIQIITELQDNGFAKIDIIDEGVGIKECVIKNIFDPFFTTKEPGEGIGLGLSIVYNILSEHKGKVSVVSEEGKGSCFTVLLPINQYNI